MHGVETFKQYDRDDDDVETQLQTWLNANPDKRVTAMCCSGKLYVVWELRQPSTER